MKKNIAFCLMLFAVAFLYAQVSTPEERIINVKQRFLKIRNTESDLEKVDSFQSLHLMVAGNIYHNEEQIGYGFNERKGEYDFSNLFKYIQPILNIGHLTIAHLRTSFSGGVPNQYCAPDELALAMKYAGISALVNANIQTAQVDKAALKRERQLMSDMDIFMTGAFTDNIDRNGNYPLIINKRGFKIALLNYSASLNGRPSISRDYIINEMDKSFIERDMRLVRAQRPDYTIVYFDWGNQNQDIPSASQIDMAKFAFQAGANMVVGTHPNMPKGIDMVNYYYNGEMKEGLVAYSLGNLVGSGREERNRNGFVLDVELKRNTYTRSTQLSEWGVIPVYTYYDTITTAGKTKVFVLPCAAVESGDIFSNIPYIEKRKTVIGAFASRKMLGGVADEIQYNLNELAVNNVVETILLTHASLNNKYSPMTMDDLKKRAAIRQEELAMARATQLPTTSSLLNQPQQAGSGNLATNKGSTTGTTANSSTQQNGTDNASTTGTKASTREQVRKELDATMNEVDLKNYNVQLKPSKAIAVQYPADTLKGQARIATTNSRAANSGGASSQISQSNSESNVNGNADVSSHKSKSQPSSTNNVNATTKVVVNDVANTESTQMVSHTATNVPKARAVTETTQGTASAKQVTTSETTIRESANATNAQGASYKAPGSYKVDNNQQVGTPKAYKLKEEEKRPDEQVIKTKGQSTSSINMAEQKINLNMGKLDAEDVVIKYDTFYRIQFYALKKMIPLDTNYYTHLKGYEVLEEDSLYKYLLGKFADYDEAYKFWNTQIQPRYKQSFIRKMVYTRRVIR